MAYGGVSRISSIYKDLGKSHKIYLHAGLITVVEFPQNILEVRLGNPKSIKAQISQVSPRELTLFLSQQSVEPTNLIVKAEMPALGPPTEVRTLKPTPSAAQQGRLLEAIKMGGD